jgi:hypothetical protein
MATTMKLVFKVSATILFMVSTYPTISSAVFALWLTWNITESVSVARRRPWRVSATIFLVSKILWRAYAVQLWASGLWKRGED